MQFSEKWLRQWINPPVDTTQLTEALTMLGLEVDRAEPVAGEFSGVVVAEVVMREPHPDADRLSICRVNVGDEQLVEVVCGAPNVRQGLKVAFATVGGVLPGDFKIKKARLRGVESHGMICSSKELGMGDGIPGTIMELPLDAPIGMDFREYLTLNDYIIDIELTPNRGDCASVYGIARDLATHFQLPVTLEIPSVSAMHHEEFPISVSAKAECPHYVGRLFYGIQKDVITPLWMAERLRRSGFRLVHPVVDITNYVMLELGQPMHAFDLDKLSEKITVRLTEADESLTLLDGQTVKLSLGTLVIADTQRVLALAGVMGGEFSAVDANTQNIFVESAYFDPATVTLSARKLSLTTDSSYRFERGVDFTLQTKAMDRFTQLLQEICGGEPGSLTAVISAEHLPTRCPIPLRAAQISRILGIDIPANVVERILQGLGMSLQANEAGWLVTSPAYRFDVSIEVDLIEEIARLYGYNKLPTTTLHAPLKMPEQSSLRLPYLRLQQLLTDFGYSEAITYSFVDPNLQRYFDPEGNFLALVNPMAADMSVMRTSLWPGLVQALQYNLNRQSQRLRLFETGLCFIQQGETLTQVEKVAGLMAGSVHDLQWAESMRTADFFDVKGHVQQMFAAINRKQEVTWRQMDHPALHPGQSAALISGGSCIGYVGVLHPNLVAKLDLSIPPVLFEINMNSLITMRAVKYKNISKFPAVRRDLAIVIEEQISAELIENKIKQYGGHLLLEVKIFDIYQGDSIEAGKKSVALNLIFQDAERTLIDEDVNQLVQGVVVGLQQEFNAILRA